MCTRNGYDKQEHVIAVFDSHTIHSGGQGNLQWGGELY